MWTIFKFLKNKNLTKNLKSSLKNTIIDKTFIYASENGTKQRNIEKIEHFLKNRYRRILGPVCGNEKENWRILTNTKIYARVKNPTKIETIRLNKLHWFGHLQRVEWNRIPKRVLYMNMGQQDWEVDQEINGKIRWERMEE